MRARKPFLTALTLLFALFAGPVEAAPDPETTKGKSKPKYEESVIEEYRVETKHGLIYGVVERPVVPKKVKVPVILTYSPYSLLQNPTDPLLNQTSAYDDADYFVPRGYARAVFDLVGTGASEGCYDYGGIRERETGEKVVNFLGTRKWSNGKVGMIGVSYDGTTQWAAAVEAPKHLTTIVPQVAIGRWYNYAFSQGVRYYSGFGTPWAFDFGFGVIPTHTTTYTPQMFADRVNPCSRLEHNTEAFLPDPVYDEFWDERDYLRRIDNVKASVMIEGSWTDYNVHPRNGIYMWDALPAGHPKRLIMSQQGHGGSDLPDEVDIRHAWFDYWLLGLDTGIMRIPAVDSKVNDNLRFQSEHWPPAGTRTVTHRLTTGGASETKLKLTDADEPVWVDDDPQHSHSSSFEGEGGENDLLFIGKPVGRPTRISGWPKLKAIVTSDTDNAWLTPVLFDEDQTGERSFITSGLLNARNRNSLRKSQPIEPGKPWKGTVEFEPIDYVLAKGHRLGLAVMSMNADEALYWSTLNSTNELNLKATKLEVPLSRK